MFFNLNASIYGPFLIKLVIKLGPRTNLEHNSGKRGIADNNRRR